MASQLTSSRPIQSRPEFADILKQEERFATPDREDLGNSINGWFDKLMLQSGLGISPSFLLLICMSVGALVGVLIFVIQENVLTAGLGAVIGASLPVLYAMLMRSRRQKAILEQMPSMIEELARAARTGRSLEQSFTYVATDTPSPLGDELRLVARKLELGLPMSEAVSGLRDRTGVTSMSVFAMALKVHAETGGDLIQVMDRLSRTVRDRMLFLGRLRAATTASRASAALMIVLPPLIVLFFLLRDPNYLTRLTSSSWGSFATITAIVLQIIGSIWVVRILRTSSRT